MGILSKVYDKVKETGQEMLGFSTEGSKAYQQLLIDGHDILNKTSDAYTTSSEFWIREKEILKSVNDMYTSNEMPEALMAREIAQEKELLKDTGVTLNVAEFRKERNEDPEYIAYVKQYMSNREKAGHYTLRADEYSEAGQQRARKRYEAPIRNTLNATSRRLKNSYGFIPALYNLTGLGRDRTLTSHTVGDYDLMLQKGDTEFNARIISKLGNYLDSKQGSLKDTDVTTLRNILKRMTNEYTAIPSGSKKGAGDMRTHPETAPRIKNIMEGTYSHEFEKLELTLTKGTPNDISDDIQVPYTTFLAPNNLTEEGGRQKFQEDLNMLSAWMLHINDDAKLVLKGGKLNPEDIITMAIGTLMELGNLKVDVKEYGYGIVEDIITSYSQLTGLQKDSVYDMLADMLSEFDEDRVFTENESALIDIEIGKLKENEIVTDPTNPVNIILNLVGGTGVEGEADYVAPVSFESIEKREAFSNELIVVWQEEDRSEQDIQEAITILETATIGETDSTVDLLGPPEVSNAEEKFPEELPPNTLKNLEGIVNPKIIPLLSKAKETYDKSAAEVIAEEKFPEELPPLTLKDLEGTVNPTILALLDKELTPEQLKSLEGASEEEIDEAVKRASFTTKPENLIASVVAALIPISSAEAQQRNDTLEKSSRLNLDNAIDDRTIKRLLNHDLVVNNPNFKNQITKENIYSSLKTELLPFLELVESSGGTALFNKVSTASGNYHFLEGTAKQVLNQVLRFDSSLKNQKWYKDMQTSLKKRWEIGTNNMKDVPLEAQSKLVIAHLLEKKVKDITGYGDELLIKFITANTVDKKIEAGLNLYYDAWHTAPTLLVRTNATRKAKDLFKELEARTKKTTGGRVSLLNRDS